MGIVIIVVVLLILGTIFNRIMRVDPTPVEQQPVELDSNADGWSRLETIVREIENSGNREFVNSERGENAPPAFYGYNSDLETINPMVNSSEKVISDFSPETYVFGESFQNRDMERETIESNLEMAKAISFNSTSKQSNNSIIDSDLTSNKNRQRAEVNFNFRDAIIYSAILNPKFEDNNLCEREISI